MENTKMENQKVQFMHNIIKKSVLKKQVKISDIFTNQYGETIGYADDFNGQMKVVILSPFNNYWYEIPSNDIEETTTV